MKKALIFSILTLILTVGVVFFALPVSSEGAEADETESLSSEVRVNPSAVLPYDTSIVIAEDLSDDAMAGAVILQNRILSVMGFKPTLKTDRNPHNTYEICIGDTNRTDTTIGTLAEGSYKIKTFTNGVEILGQGKRGMTYGVYEFLRKYAGFEWYTSYITVKKSYVLKPVDVDITYTPYFEYTDTDWSSPTDTEYSLAHGLTGGTRRYIPFFEGGSVDYLSSFCHTLSTQFCSAEEYFEEHPEYFALHDGERVGQQLCLTNPDVLAIVIEEVMELLNKYYDREAPLQIISLTQADNEDYCQCENCKRLDEENSAHSGSMITFVNQVAQAVKDAGYDNVAIDTFAYRYTRACPTTVKPLDNVIVRLCTIECCFTHSLDDATCPENVSLMKDLSDWGKICNRIYVWDYTTNYAHTCGVFPDFGVIQRNMQIFYENNVKGVYEEGNYYVSSCDTEFSELRSYLLSVLMQNPYCDYYSEMDKFLVAYYGGEAAPYIRKFIDKTIENGAKQHVQIYSSMPETFSFTDEEVAELDALWGKAISFYEGKEDEASEAYLERIERSEISWLFWEASCDKGVFAGSGKYKARAELIERMNQSGAVQMCEGTVTGKISSVMALFPLTFWQSGDILDLYIGVAVVFGILLVCSLVLLVVGICKKKLLPCLLFPLTACAILLFAWSLSLFLSWSNVGLYAFSCILITLVVGCYAFVWYRERYPKNKLWKSLLFSGINGILSGAVLQTGILAFVHGVIFQYGSSHTAFCIILFIQAFYILFFMLTTLIGLLKKKK